jgi:hypothetical protein
MPFAALEDDFHSNPKVIAAGNEGAGLYARALSYCGAYLTDGKVPKKWAAQAAGSRRTLPRKLVDVGLWRDEGDHFVIPDYLTYNPPREYVMAKRAELSQKRSEAGKLGARARWAPSNQHGKPDGKDDANMNGKSEVSGMASEWPPAPNPTKANTTAAGTEEKEESGLHETAAAEPPRQSEVRAAVDALGKSDDKGHDAIWILAAQLTAESFSTIVATVHERKATRNKVGLLRRLLEAAVRELDKGRALALAEAVAAQPAQTTLDVVKRMVRHLKPEEREEFIVAEVEARHLSEAERDELLAFAGLERGDEAA